MKYCEECFKDENFKQYIQKNGIQSSLFTCVHCGSVNSKYLLDGNKLSLWVKKIIYNVYSYEDAMAYSISKNFVEHDETIIDYAPFKNLYSVCGELFSCEANDIVNIINNDNMIRDIYKYGSNENFSDPDIECWLKNCWFDHSPRYLNWNKFSENIKHSLRFFNSKDFNRKKELEKLTSLFDALGSYKLLSPLCYRARGVILKNMSRIKENPEKELGFAPPEKSKHNRFSPSGISYIYLAFDKKTAYKEVYESNSLNYFMSCWELNITLSLLDLRKDRFEEILRIYTNPFDDKYDSYIKCGNEFLIEFIHEIQKPIAEDDKVLEYIPTQVLAEYIRVKGYDGFVFNSSKNTNGINLVLFEKNSLKFIDYEKVK